MKFKAKIGKRKFERKILDDEKSYPNDVTARIHTEMDGTKVTLYYSGQDAKHGLPKHIGSWCRGEGWLF